MTGLEADNVLGTITVTAEVEDRSNAKIETLHDVTTKYSKLEDEQKEHLYAVFLTNSNKVIGDKLIGLGDTDAVQFDVKDIARTATLVNAGAVILVHNHPSGTAEVTQADISTTRDIHDALKLLGVQLLDHVIIAHNDHYSMKAQSDGPF